MKKKSKDTGRATAQGYVAVGTTADVPPGAVRVFKVNRENVAVACVDGQWYAFADICTHDGGPLVEGELDDCAIECPRHGARFDIRTGRVLALPAVVPLPIYEVKVEGETIWVGRRPR